MRDRMQTITPVELDHIHNASIQILGNVGVAFHDSEAIAIFKKHGAETQGNIIRPNERLVQKALESCPSQFTITARNPQHNLSIGADNLVLAPGYGAAFIISKSGQQSRAVMDDYKKFCKLVQTSGYVDMNGFLMVTPWDVPAETGHLHMLYSNLTLCDKVFMGCSISRQGAVDSLEMAEIVWGGKNQLRNLPVMLALISSLSPLQYSQEMTGALIEFAEYAQPLVIAAGPKAGSSGPVTIAGLLALQNAEILAGITLAQLVRPGTPIVYGGIPCPMDLRTGTIPYGTPELSKITSAISQIAKYYGLPSRGGGAITDAHLPDIQAGIESTLALTTAALNGINLIIHACGMLSSFLAISFEKFIIDEEFCGMIRNLLEPISISMDETDLPTIKSVGIGGEYLSHPKTLERCRTEFFLTKLMNRLSYEPWTELGQKRLEDRAQEVLNQRLSDYRQPARDANVEQALSQYISKRENR